MKKVAPIILFLALCGAVIAAPQDCTFRASCDASEQRYMVIEANGDEGARRPADVLIALHGHGSDRTQFATQTRGECQASRDIAAERGMLFVSPDYRAKTSWMGPAAESDMLDLIALLKRQRNVRRVFLCGGSMGGTSALTFAARHPELIAGVTAFNPLADHLSYTNFQSAIAASFGGDKKTIPAEYRARSALYFPDSFTMPVSITLGGADTTVPPASARALALEIQKRRPDLIYLDENPKRGHATEFVASMKALREMFLRADAVGRAEKPFAICSFNMLTDNSANTGDLAWTNRLPRILKIIEDHKLDVIGAQELRENQVVHLREALGPKGYEIVGRGRLAEGKGEGVYIIYNAKRFDRTASGTFQLSETPDVLGSSSWNSACPRTCVWVQLKDRESGTEFRLYNTHLDHVSELARRKGMELVVGRINADVSVGMTAFLTGDFNNELEPGNAIDYVRKSMRDTAELSLTPHQGPVKTFHDYDPPACMLIDYVFAKGKVKVLSHATLDDMPDGKLPSDHFPVAVIATL